MTAGVGASESGCGDGTMHERERRTSVFEVLARLHAAMRPLAELQREIEAIRPRLPRLDEQETAITRIVQGQRRLAEAMKGFRLEPVVAVAGKLARHARNAQKLDAGGWLPHHSTPFDRVDACEGDSSELNAVLLRYYGESWPEVRRGIESRMTGYTVDDEAKATVGEALEAHEAGLYRSVCRVLMPEVERVARAELHDGSLERITSQKRLRKLSGRLPLFSVDPPGLYSLNLYRRLSNHLYDHIGGEEDLQRFACDPVPNRHAVVHGLIVYSSMQNSLNAIFMADYIFLVISVLKRMASETVSD